MKEVIVKLSTPLQNNVSFRSRRSSEYIDSFSGLVVYIMFYRAKDNVQLMNVLELHKKLCQAPFAFYISVSYDSNSSIYRRVTKCLKVHLINSKVSFKIVLIKRVHDLLGDKFFATDIPKTSWPLADPNFNDNFRETKYTFFISTSADEEAMKILGELIVIVASYDNKISFEIFHFYHRRRDLPASIKKFHNTIHENVD